MKRVIALGAVVLMTGLLALPSSSLAGPPEAAAARTYCKAERQKDPADFRGDYGRGAVALGRCARKQLAESKAECRGERRKGPSRFATLYGGTGAAAINKCVREDLRVTTSPSY